MGITNGSPSIISGQTTATVSATVYPARAPQSVSWTSSSDLVSISQPSANSVTITGTNNTGRSQYVPVDGIASNGFRVTAWVYVQPPYINAPTFAVPPSISIASNETATLNYAFNPVANRTDQSVITWYSCADAGCSAPRVVGISNGGIPLQTYTLQGGDIRKYLQATIQPKWDISNAGTAVTTISSSPVPAVQPTTVSPNFLNFPPNPESAYISGYWTVLGTWTSEPQPCGGNFRERLGLESLIAGRISSLPAGRSCG